VARSSPPEVAQAPVQRRSQPEPEPEREPEPAAAIRGRLAPLIASGLTLPEEVAMVAKGQQRKAFEAAQELGPGPFLVQLSIIAQESLRAFPDDLRVAAQDAIAELEHGTLGMCNGAAALKPLTGKLAGRWRVAFGTLQQGRFVQYRLVVLPGKAPNRGPQPLLVEYVLARSEVYEAMREQPLARRPAARRSRQP